jgi:hypothetical protein
MEAKLDLTNKATDIKLKIDLAKQKAYQTGIYSDRKQWNRMNTNYNKTTAQIRLIETEMSKRNRKFHNSQQRLAVAFLDAARDTLDNKDYQAVLEEARSRLHTKE